MSDKPIRYTVVGSSKRQENFDDDDNQFREGYQVGKKLYQGEKHTTAPSYMEIYRFLLRCFAIVGRPIPYKVGLIAGWFLYLFNIQQP